MNGFIEHLSLAAPKNFFNRNFLYNMKSIFILRCPRWELLSYRNKVLDFKCFLLTG